MFEINSENIKSWNMKFRPMFGKLIKEVVKEYQDAVLVVADSARACRLDGFEEFPEKLIDCGIAEQSMTGVAAGLAHCGKIPITFAFSTFAAERCFEQIKIDIAYSNLHVIIVGSEGGTGLGTQGVTHFGWEDIGIIRSLPNMTILCPADNAELIKCLEAALKMDGPVYLRLNGGVPKPVYHEDYAFEIGKGIVHKTGKDINIVTSGPSLSIALDAAEILEKEGISVGAVDMHTIKPIDECLILSLARTAPEILTIEEHSIVNGLGSAVSDVLATHKMDCGLTKIGLPDEYPHTVSPYPYMLEDFGITVDNVVRTIREKIKIAV